MGFDPLPRQDIVYFHEYNRSPYIQISQNQENLIDKKELIALQGDQGYLTAISSHGISGQNKHEENDSCFYFEVDVLPPKTPLPFVNVKPAVRVGVCNLEAQDADKPLGSNKLSYAYSSTGQMINNCRADQKNFNDTFCKYFAFNF